MLPPVTGAAAKGPANNPGYRYEQDDDGLWTITLPNGNVLRRLTATQVELLERHRGLPNPFRIGQKRESRRTVGLAVRLRLWLNEHSALRRNSAAHTKNR